ncbi:5-formyltetrahydrofolate cyclo-ligase [Wallemia mellicola]|uniref:5-formyltetrahydrofolate cyclo-ligase n=1 Tax=Wallemia mellicola TaxID=1708541 RepID=A0A4T0QM41_9BASI|nr:hypothetical protein E3Q24_02869 [Wallemia mellicola]TIB76459.1 hypothetical protein E3Q23_01821 [Wallemia mellicola]TIB81382.1 5-formyltetrahydrofolate cyclo-ligase [Wallemia mellicola]TIB88719.1 5-formyltetrahydrofolate cyclo-ligase [Wallemia mellicola]TIB91453.1 5-formyltetrahydrofolate cyclo-ligase [Wallemia mellicola]
MQSLKLLKRNLRKSTLKKLSEISNEAISLQSSLARAVKEEICASDIYKRSTRISLYLSMQSSELSTDDLARQIIDDGKKLFVPFIHTNEVPTMSMLNIPTVEQLQALKRNKWGIPEPDAADVDKYQDALALSSESPGLDLILVPAVAYDKSFNRLGHGMGYYDRFIKAATTHAEGYALHPPTIVGLALQEQIQTQDSVPTGPLDEVMDAIATSDGITWNKQPE